MAFLVFVLGKLLLKGLARAGKQGAVDAVVMDGEEAGFTAIMIELLVGGV